MTKADKNVCVGNFLEDEKIQDLKRDLPDDSQMLKLSSIFKALSDPTRLRIIYLLSKSSLCVCDMSNILDMSQSSISHHLRVLRDTHLVKFKKDGKMVIYSLDDDHVYELFEQGLNHVKHI